MKDYHIYIFENLENLSKTVGFINVREKFVDNSFVDDAYVLLSLSEDFTYQKEIPLIKIKKHLTKVQGLTVPQYSNKYAKEINIINDYLEITQDNLSWLDIFQLALIIKDTISIDNQHLIIKKAINDLIIFKKFIEEKY
jgi:hypothetical protein